MPTARFRPCSALLLAVLLCVGGAPAHAQAEAPSRHLAPGFTARPAASRLVILPADMELYSISAGGVAEPRADWTEAAQQHFSQALQAQGKRLGTLVATPEAPVLDDLGELLALHRGVADAVFFHHTQRSMQLPTKRERLDWSLGAEAVQPLSERTGADYALFTWIRDSYASGERKAAIVAMALLGGLLLGGEQVGYASLVDLKTGRVVWFNDLSRMSGDLREPRAAAETVEALLENFPGQR